jgi:hypothetical protein
VRIVRETWVPQLIGGGSARIGSELGKRPRPGKVAELRVRARREGLALCEPFTVPPGPVTELNRPAADAAQPDTAS